MHGNEVFQRVRHALAQVEAERNVRGHFARDRGAKLGLRPIKLDAGQHLITCPDCATSLCPPDKALPKGRLAEQLCFGIGLADYLLVARGKIAVPSDLLARFQQPSRHRIVHDRLGIVGAHDWTSYLCRFEDLFRDLIVRPIVGTAGVVTIYLLFVPDDAGIFAFVFVNHTEGVAKFVQNHAPEFVAADAVTELQVHRLPIRINARCIGSQVRPMTIRLVVDPNISLFGSGLKHDAAMTGPFLGGS